MRVLLASFAGYPLTPTNFMPDNGLANLAACLREAGHDPLILDLNTVEVMDRLFPAALRPKLADLSARLLDPDARPRPTDLPRLLWYARQVRQHQEREFATLGHELDALADQFGADMVGLKLWNGDGLTAAGRFVRALKHATPQRPVFAGGPHVDLFRGLIYEACPGLDGLVYGDGEEAIVAVADALAARRGLGNLPNFISPDADPGLRPAPRPVPALDALPLPCYDPEVYPAMGGHGKAKLIVLDDSRGCSNRCAFCMHPEKSGPYRTKSAARLVDEMDSLRARHGVRAFRLGGSSPRAPQLRALAHEILNRDVDVTYCSFAELRQFQPGDLPLLGRSGCFGLFFGLETADPQLARVALGKALDPDLAADTIRWARQAGVFAVTSVIFPCPGETHASRERTLTWLLDAQPDSVPVQFPGLYPGTRWLQAPERFGFDLDPRRYPRQVMNYKIALLLPPQLWRPLPYRIDGKPYRVYARETAAFVRELEAAGLLTMVSDDVALLARAAGMTPRAFRDHCRLAFLSGDTEAVAELVTRINTSITSGVHAGRQKEYV